MIHQLPEQSVPDASESEQFGPPVFGSQTTRGSVDGRQGTACPATQDDAPASFVQGFSSLGANMQDSSTTANATSVTSSLTPPLPELPYSLRDHKRNIFIIWVCLGNSMN